MPNEQIPVSVFVPFYEGERFLPGLVATLQGQGDIEVVIVVDGGQGLPAVRAAVSELPDAKVVWTTDPLGTAGARNFGSRTASRHWITFLDQDDAWPDGMLRKLLENTTDRVIAYDNDLYDEVNGKPRAAGQTVFEKAAWSHELMTADDAGLLLAGFPMVKLVMPRRWFRAAGSFSESIYAVEDFDLVWRLLRDGREITFSRAPRGKYVVRPESITGRIARGHGGRKSRG